VDFNNRFAHRKTAAQNDQTDIEALAKKSNSDYFAGMNRL